MLDQKILKKIGSLEDTHCKGCVKIKGRLANSQATSICKACPIGQEIMELGQRIEITKEKQLLSKGQDLNFDEIMQLIHNGTPVVNIMDALGWGRTRFRTYMKKRGRDAAGRKLKKGAKTS